MHRIMTTTALIATAGAAAAEGELNIYNWGNYTSPELIEKFEEEYDVDVTVTDYDSNTTALTRVQQGGHGFDIVVPSANYVPVFVEEGLLMEPGIPEMENFEHVAERWRDVEWDPGRRHTVPWQWGTTGVSVNASIYDGNPHTSDIWLDPPEELRGRVNVIPEMADVMGLAILYAGGEPCTEDRELLREVRDLLAAAREHWVSMDYGMTEQLANGDVAASVNWNGSSFRARLNNPDIIYGYPEEGYLVWMDSAGILADAENVENAKLFLNFIMEPENAAMISEFARYANGIEGSEEFMPEEMQGAPEIDVPEEHQDAGIFLPTCPSSATELYTAIWTDLMR